VLGVSAGIVIPLPAVASSMAPIPTKGHICAHVHFLWSVVNHHPPRSPSQASSRDSSARTSQRPAPVRLVTMERPAPFACGSAPRFFPIRSTSDSVDCHPKPSCWSRNVGPGCSPPVGRRSSRPCRLPEPFYSNRTCRRFACSVWTAWSRARESSARWSMAKTRAASPRRARPRLRSCCRGGRNLAGNRCSSGGVQ